MPLTKKGRKIKRAMEKFYGKKKGAQVFYASERAGTLPKSSTKRRRHRHG